MAYQESIHCPPYVPPGPADVDHAGRPVTSILTLAARASEAVNAYRHAMDTRADFDTTLRLAGAMSRAAEVLCIAIADNVACGDNRLS